MPRLIGMFKADQQRERGLLRDDYSHLVVVFDVGLVLVEASPLRDASAAAIHHVPVPLPHHAKQARRLIRLGPKFSHVESKVAAIDQISPEGLAAAFPGHVTRLWNEQITSAVLRRYVRQLRLRYRSQDHGGEMQVWLKLPLSARIDEVAGLMAATLGDRYRESAPVWGVLAAVGDLLPGT